jgi:hypothetical protein
MYINVQPNTIVNFFKAELYFNEEQQCEGDVCLENNDVDDNGYDWQIVADTLCRSTDYISIVCYNY